MGELLKFNSTIHEMMYNSIEKAATFVHLDANIDYGVTRAAGLPVAFNAQRSLHEYFGITEDYENGDVNA